MERWLARETWPESAVSRPSTMRIRVLLPAPLGPISATRERWPMCASAPSNKTFEPYCLLMPWRWSMELGPRATLTPLVPSALIAARGPAVVFPALFPSWLFRPRDGADTGAKSWCLYLGYTRCQNPSRSVVTCRARPLGASRCKVRGSRPTQDRPGPFSCPGSPEAGFLDPGRLAEPRSWIRAWRPEGSLTWTSEPAPRADEGASLAARREHCVFPVEPP